MTTKTYKFKVTAFVDTTEQTNGMFDEVSTRFTAEIVVNPELQAKEKMVILIARQLSQHVEVDDIEVEEIE